MKNTILETDFIFQKVFGNKWKTLIFFWLFFHSFFELLKLITFSMVYQYMSVFKYDFSTNFSLFLIKKESFFVKNWRLLILVSIDNRFLTLKSSEKILWTSTHHFEKSIFVTKLKFKIQKMINTYMTPLNVRYHKCQLKKKKTPPNICELTPQVC